MNKPTEAKSLLIDLLGRDVTKEEFNALYIGTMEEYRHFAYKHYQDKGTPQKDKSSAALQYATEYDIIIRRTHDDAEAYVYFAPKD